MNILKKVIFFFFFLIIPIKCWGNNLPILSKDELSNFQSKCASEINLILKSDQDYKIRTFKFFEDGKTILSSLFENPLNPKSKITLEKNIYSYEDLTLNKIYKLNSNGASIKIVVGINYKLETHGTKGWTKSKFKNKKVIFECIFLNTPKNKFLKPNIIIEYFYSDQINDMNKKNDVVGFTTNKYILTEENSCSGESKKLWRNIFSAGNEKKDRRYSGHYYRSNFGCNKKNVYYYFYDAVNLDLNTNLEFKLK